MQSQQHDNNTAPFLTSVEQYLKLRTHDRNGRARSVKVLREMKRAVCAVTGYANQNWFNGEELRRKTEVEREVFERVWGEDANRKAVEEFAEGGKKKRGG